MRPSKSQGDFLYARATIYKTRVKLFIPKDPIPRGFRIEGDRTRNPNKESSEETIENSLYRTRSMIRDYVWCNRFELFATFTFKNERNDIDKCKRKMAFWLKRAKKLYPSLQYLIVPEFHKDGKALHFHALLKGYGGEVKRSVNKKGKPKSDKRGNKLYHIPSYRAGYSDVKFISQDIESHQRIGNYVRKYITKDMPVFYNKNRYWASKGLKKPIQIDNPSTEYAKFKPDWWKENDHGRVGVFTRTPELRALEDYDV